VATIALRETGTESAAEQVRLLIDRYPSLVISYGFFSREWFASRIFWISIAIRVSRKSSGLMYCRTKTASVRYSTIPYREA